MLDAVDAVLVRELQRDGRATFQALADRVGLSRTAVRARVQHLLETQVVRVVGIVHAAVVGAEAIGHVSLTVDGSAREAAAAVAERPAVSFAALIAGPYDLVAQVRTRDDAALAAEVDLIRSIPGVRAAEVFRSVSTVRDKHAVVREHYGAELRPERLRVDFAIQEEPRGTADAVLAVEEWTGGEPFIVINSDNRYPAEALGALRAAPAPALVGFDRDALVRDGNIPAERIARFALLDVDGSGALRRIVEKPTDADAVRLGDSAYPVSSGSGGQWGGNCSASGVYAACMKLREAVAQKVGVAPADAVFGGDNRGGLRCN